MTRCKIVQVVTTFKTNLRSHKLYIFIGLAPLQTQRHLTKPEGEGRICSKVTETTGHPTYLRFHKDHKCIAAGIINFHKNELITGLCCLFRKQCPSQQGHTALV